MRSACLDEYQHAVLRYANLFLFCRNGRVLVLAQGFFDLLLDFEQGSFQRGGLCGNFGEVRNMGGAAVRGQGAEYRVRETQNQNDADDANDAESGIWYRDIPKTASLASSASLSSRKNSEGVWGTPQKCVCGYPNAMLAKHILSQGVSNQTGHPYKFVYISE